MLSPRQELILKLVVDAYLASGHPVPSKELVELPGVEWGASTVRAELAALEAAGYLTHPHTSAGRVPTESGYRRHVDLMMASGGPSVDAAVELELSRLRREIEEAMRKLATSCSCPPAKVSSSYATVRCCQCCSTTDCAARKCARWRCRAFISAAA